ncbi:MAG: ABC-type transport auxiliary lipoprotein family protein [Rhodanobacteraceae bacterium]
MKLRSIALLAFIALTLAACSSPTVPDFTYFRLPRSEPLPESPSPLFKHAIVVDVFGADGLYADQSLIYALDPSAQELRQYHYQLWTDPPTRILQRRLILQLRDAKASEVVTDELPASSEAVRVSGVILRFDRVPTAEGGFSVVVALKLRADAPDGTPLIDDFYRAELPAGGANLKASVDAYGAAIDQIYAQFYADLRKHGDRANAG